MAENSKIEWTDASWTPIRAREASSGRIGWHCEHASEGCRNCYAETMNRRLGTGLDFKPGHRADIEISLDEKMLLAPLRWKKPRMIFVCSMTDAFADFVKDEWLDRMFAVMALTPQHTYQMLTKRADRMRDYLYQMTRQEWWKARLYTDDKRPNVYPNWPLPNVWLGVSAEDQQRADERIPLLLQTPAAVRFVSLEPLLGPIDLTVIAAPDDPESGWTFSALETGDYYSFKDNRGYQQNGDGPYREHHLDWVIVGGESGVHARPMHPDWALSLKDQCAAADVKFFFKQWGSWKNGSDFAKDAHVVLIDGRHVPEHESWLKLCGDDPGVTRLDPRMMRRVGKKAAGRLLYGIEHNGMPSKEG